MDSLATDFENHAEASAQDKANLIDKVSENKAESTEVTEAPGSGNGDSTGSSGGGGKDTVGSSTVVQFDEEALIKNRVFGTEDDQAITYALRDGAEFLSVNLVAKNKGFQTLANATYDQKDEEFDDPRGPFSSVNTTHAVLKNSDNAFGNYYGDEMYINITWQTTSNDKLEIGSSWSTYFTVDDNVGVDTAEDDTKRKALLEQSNQDNRNGFETTASSGPLPTSTGGASNIENPGVSGDGNGDQISESDDPASSSGADSDKGSGGGGMSTGATAGAAVGGVVGGLLIIGAIVWFLLRRRRQKKFQDDRSGEQTYVVDKETQGGRSTDSPNMGYTDGGHSTKPVPLESINHDRDDSAIPRNSLGARSRGGNSGVQTPQGISSNVAHLVEDGMTADEIRRLEEEERQLDDEIERAARR